MYCLLHECKFLLYLDKYLGVGYLDYMGYRCLIIRSVKWFSRLAGPFCLPISNIGEFQLLYILTSNWWCPTSIYCQFFLFEVDVFCKVIGITELVNSVSRPPALGTETVTVIIFSSADRYITLFLECVALRTQGTQTVKGTFHFGSGCFVTLSI